MWRSLAERLSDKIILKRWLPQEFGGGPLFVSPGASLRYWRFDLVKVDPMLLGITRSCINQGDVVWDVGANVGLLSFAAAGIVGEKGQVLAIEADTGLVELLRKSALLPANARLPFDVLPLAISDRVGLAQFNIARRGRATNYLADSSGSMETGGVREKRLVPTVTLDWLLEWHSPPNFIKIDVEGAEYQVLAGGTKVLEQVRPTILCEVSDRSDEVGQFFHQFDYQLYRAETGEAIDRPVFNTLARPRSV